jgi:hypothetical protein
MFDFDLTPESGRAARARPRPSAPPASRSSSPSSRSHPPRSSSSRAPSFGLVCAARAGEVLRESVERGRSGWQARGRPINAAVKKSGAKSAFSFAAFKRSGVNRLGGVGENPTRSIASRPSFSSRASPFFPATLSDSVGHANPRSRRFPHLKRRFSRESDQDADRRIERSAGCLSGRARPIAPAFDTATRPRPEGRKGARLGSAFFGPRGAFSFLASTRRRR